MLFPNCTSDVSKSFKLLKSKDVQVFYLSHSQQLICVHESDSRAEVEGLSLKKTQSYSRTLNLCKTEAWLENPMDNGVCVNQ